MTASGGNAWITPTLEAGFQGLLRKSYLFK